MSKIVVSCPKRIFVQKRLERVNHGRRVGDPLPPPVPKVVGLNCVVLFLVLLGKVAYKISFFLVWVGWVGGVEKLILKLTLASTGVGVEARAELGNKSQNQKLFEKKD